MTVLVEKSATTLEDGIKTLIDSAITDYKKRYGDGEKAICIERFGSAFISEGRIDVYCPQPHDRIIHYDLDILEETEIYNDTVNPIYVNLDECSLIPEISGDRKLTMKNGVMPEDEIQKFMVDK